MAKLKAITWCLLALFIFLVILDIATFGVLIGVGKLKPGVLLYHNIMYQRLETTIALTFFHGSKRTVWG